MATHLAPASSVELLPHDALIRTSEVDEADWIYRPLLGWIQRIRFRMAAALLGDGDFGRLLEVGFGSGVFAPHLARSCRELYGIDVHDRAAAVSERLRSLGLRADLRSASVTQLPFGSGFFDAAVAVSSLEFVDDLDSACRELVRVLAPGGVLVVITPGFSPLVDAGLKLLTGRSAEADFAGRRQRLAEALERHFKLLREKRFPSGLLGGRLTRLYSGLLLGPRERCE